MPDTIYTAKTATDYDAFAGLIREYVEWSRTRYRDNAWFIERTFSHQSLESELDKLSTLRQEPAHSEVLSGRRTALLQMLSTLKKHATTLDAHRRALRDRMERGGEHGYGRVPLFNRSAFYSLSEREREVVN